MSTLIFSPVFGENITIDKNSRQARWEPKRSGGWVFSATALEAGKEITVTLNGSGHCDVGVIKSDPTRCDVTRGPAQFKKLNGIQIHKMRCCIPVSLNREGNEVTSKYQGEVFRKPVNKKSSVWISVYVKFGEVTAELVEETSGKLNTFSETHGTNIRLEVGKRKAVTINSNPAALCFVGQAFMVGETVTVVCEPLKVGSKTPSRFHVKLLVCRKNPESFHDDFRSAFDTSVEPLSDPPITVLEILEKEECNGTVSITLDQSLHMRYVSATNKQNNQNLNFDASNGVWVGFELYRVSILLKSSKKSQIQTLGFDVPDSRIREPQNENAEDSIQPFNSFVNRLQNHHKDNYVSEERADLMSRNRTMSINNTTKKLNVGHNMPVQQGKRDYGHHMYQNICIYEKGTKPKATKGYVQRQPDRVKVQNTDYVLETNHDFSTAPKALTITRPLQIPAPKKSPTTMSETRNSPSKTTFRHQNDKMQDTKVVSEIFSNQQIASTSLKSMTEESLIVSHLSRIERTLSHLAETVTFGHTTDDTLHRQGSRSGNNLPDSDEPTNDFIQKNWVNLVENVCADKLCDYLFQACYIRDDERQLITDQYKMDCQAANRQLLQLIKKRRVPTSSLVKIFKDAEQGHLVVDLKQ